MTPRIAIPIPTTIDMPYNQRSWIRYAEAIERSGGEAVAIDLGSTPAMIREIASTCQGFLLPGSPADVNPELYGADRDPECGPVDVPRETADYILLDEAAAQSKPVLGICYGIQSLNVWAGGTLIQDLTPLPVNHSAGSSVAIAHSTLIAKHTLLAEILQGTEAVDDSTDPSFLRLPINTSHHQSVAAPGDELRIVARSPEDGVVEAVELPYEGPEPQFLLGVQWHPERSFDISAASRALFGRLIAEANKVPVATP